MNIIGCKRESDSLHVKSKDIRKLKLDVIRITSQKDFISSKASGKALIQDLRNIKDTWNRIEQFRQNDPSIKKSKLKQLNKLSDKLTERWNSSREKVINRSYHLTSTRPEQPLDIHGKDTYSNTYWNKTDHDNAMLLVSDPRLLWNDAKLLCNGAKSLLDRAKLISCKAKLISCEAKLISCGAELILHTGKSLSHDDLSSLQEDLSIERKQFSELSNELAEDWGSLNEKVFERSCRNSTNTIPEKPLDRRDKNIYTNNTGLVLDEARSALNEVKLLLDEAKLRALTS